MSTDKTIAVEEPEYPRSSFTREADEQDLLRDGEGVQSVVKAVLGVKEKGIDLILQEREEQIHKHGFSLESDRSHVEGELEQVAMYCESQADNKISKGATPIINYPRGWLSLYKHKIDHKSVIEQLTLAGAFYVAEYDRTKRVNFLKAAFRIAERIDRILKV